jgi:hypothetical protein
MNGIDAHDYIVSRAVSSLIALALVATACVAQAPQPVHPTFSRLRDESKSSQDTVGIIVRYGYAMSAQFDTAEGAGDAQRLMLGDCTTKPPTCRYGPFARVQPRLRRPNWDVEPPSDTGEVIARIISDSSPYVARVQGRDTIYKFNIHGRDTVYWWVGPRRPRDTTLVSIFVSSRGERPLVSNVKVGPHSRRDRMSYWQQGLARWIWTDRDEDVWGTCDGGRCCQSGGLAFQD